MDLIYKKSNPCEDCLVDVMCIEPCNKFSYAFVSDFEFFIHNVNRYARLINSAEECGRYSFDYRVSQSISFKFYREYYTVNYFNFKDVLYNIKNKRSGVIHNLIGLRFFHRPGKLKSSWYVASCDIHDPSNFKPVNSKVTCKKCLMFMNGQFKSKPKYYD